MKVKGHAWKFGDDIDTDQIYPGKYLPLTDKHEMARHAMEGAEGGDNFLKQVKGGDIIVAGKNFGCGSSREHAPIAIKGKGVSLVIAQSFARIFRRNSINIGLPILELDSVDQIQENDLLSIDVATGEVKNITQNKQYDATPVSSLEMEIMNAGGLLQYLKEMKDQ